jgi:Flp pilus assembly protein TadB
MRRRLEWDEPREPPPKHPYRDTILVYSVLALVVVGFAWLTGGDLTRALVVAALFWLAGTAYGLVAKRRRLRRRRELP